MTPSTQPQVELLVKFGVPRAEAKGLSKISAQQKLMELRSQPTPKQLAFMMRLGMPLIEAKKMNPEEAFAWIASHNR